MNSVKKNTRRTAARMQSGVSMVIVLIFVVILTSLGTYALRRVLLDTNISRNSLDLQLAKQAAQAALRDGERDILSLTASVPGAACARQSNAVAAVPAAPSVAVTSQRPMPPVLGYNFAPPEWGANCPMGQCVVGSGKRADAYPGSNFNTPFASNSAIQPWWPAQTPGTDPPVWNNNFAAKAGSCNFTGGVPYGKYTAAPPVQGVWQQPEYLIEAVRTGFVIYYRITARGWGQSPNSETVMQSIVRTQIK